MLPFEVLEFIGKIQRRQDRDIYRADRVAIRAKFPDAFVDSPGQRLHPFVVLVARDGEVLAHDFDVHAFHLTWTKIEYTLDDINITRRGRSRRSAPGFSRSGS